MHTLKSLLFLGLLTHLLTPAAQSQSRIADVSLPETPGLDGTLYAIYPDADGALYFVSAGSAPGGVTIAVPVTTSQKMMVTKLNKDSTFEKKITLEGIRLKSSSDGSNPEFFVVNNELYAIWVESKDGAVVKYAPVEQSSASKTLATFSVKGRSQASDLSLLRSDDASKFAVVFKFESVENAQTAIVVFDASMQVLGEYLDLEDEGIMEKKQLLNNDGSVLHAEILSPEVKKGADRIVSLNCALLKNSAVVNTFKDQQGVVNDVSLSLASNDELFAVNVMYSQKKKVTGKNSKPEERDMYSVRQILMNATDLAIVRDVSDQLSHATVEKVKQGEKLYANGLTLAGAFMMEDSSQILIAEAHSGYAAYITTRFNDGALPIIHNQPTITKVHEARSTYTGILNIHLGKQGVIQDTRSVSREINLDVLYLLPVNPKMINGAVYYTCFNKDKSISLVRVGIDDTGELDQGIMPVLVDEMKNRPIDPGTMITDGQNTIYAGLVWHKKGSEFLKIVTQ